MILSLASLKGSVVQRRLIVVAASSPIEKDLQRFVSFVSSYGVASGDISVFTLACFCNIHKHNGR